MAGEAIGWGGKFLLHNGSTLFELERVGSVTPPEDVADEHEVTSLSSPNRRKEYIVGMIDGGELTVEIMHVPNSTTDQLCRAAKAAGDVRAWKIVYPDTAGLPLRQDSGTGFVRSYKVNAVEPNAPMTATLTIRITGAVTEGAAS
jgi:hypothetical protein